MESVATAQYPQVVWRGGEKMLWNAIHRKALKNRPEERVRLRIIEYLMQAGWSKHRISTEEAIRNIKKGSLRTDIICYNQQFDPKILVECKAEHIPLSEKTAEQVARYNQNVEAPFLLMSNGIEDYWYHIDPSQKSVEQLTELPDVLPSSQTPERNFSYWKERGFTGDNAVPELRNWVTPLLQHFSNGQQKVQYLQFKKSPTDLDLNHYYYINPVDEDDARLALTFLDTPFGGSRIIGILNKDGQNKAVIELNLDLLFNGEKPNASVYSSEGTQNIDAVQIQDGQIFNIQKPQPLSLLMLDVIH